MKLVSRPRADGSRRYVCASGPGFGGCGKTTILAEPLELFVAEAVLHRLDSPELAASLSGVPDDPDGAVWQAERGIDVLSPGLVLPKHAFTARPSRS